MRTLTEHQAQRSMMTTTLRWKMVSTNRVWNIGWRVTASSGKLSRRALLLHSFTPVFLSLVSWWWARGRIRKAWASKRRRSTIGLRRLGPNLHGLKRLLVPKASRLLEILGLEPILATSLTTKFMLVLQVASHPLMQQTTKKFPLNFRQDCSRACRT